MGLIRKTLMVGTLGVVRGSSKKQRIAKKQLKATKKIANQMNKAQPQATAPQNNFVNRPPQNIPTPQVTDPYAELERLADLKQKGFITQADYDGKKKQLLGL